VTGPIALHGGGEYLAGDERVIAALLDLVPDTGRAVRIAVVPTAAARGRPDLAGGNGVAAFQRVAAAAGRAVEAAIVPVVDAASAADPALADRLRDADLIAFPGGDPDLIPTLLRGSAAWSAITEALDRGALLAGASAGAMALGPWTWTPHGGVHGLGLVPGVVVVPHVDARSWPDIARRWGAALPAGLHALGLGERTAVIIEPGRPWRVVGEGEVRWLPSGTPPDSPLVLVDGGEFTP
jgi:cyanophycinase